MSPTGPDPTAPRRWRGLGVPVDAVDLDTALDWAERRLAAGAGGWVVTPNPEIAVAAWRDERLRAALDAAPLSLADGGGLLWASLFLGGPLHDRVMGIEFLDCCLARCAARGWPVFLLGAKPGVAAEAARRAAARWPGLVVAGTQHGYFTGAEAAEVRAAIAAARPRFLAVGMGHPRQEVWLADNMPHLPGVLGLACGGSLDVLAGRVRRAPGWVQRAELEWLYRLLASPRARWRRSLALPRFVATVLYWGWTGGGPPPRSEGQEVRDQ